MVSLAFLVYTYIDIRNIDVALQKEFQVSQNLDLLHSIGHRTVGKPER